MSMRFVARAAVAAVLATVAVPASAGAQTNDGIVDGLSTTDFAFVNTPQTTSGSVGQVTISQTAAAAANREMKINNSLGELLVHADTNSNQFAARNAYAHGSGVSTLLGSPPGDTPQIQETTAEAFSPPASHQRSSIADVPAAPLATASVLPSTADANTARNTSSPSDFCPTLGGPISDATANVAAAAIAPTDSVAPGFALASLDSVVHNESTQFLASNGQSNAFGLVSQSTLNTTGVTLFKNVPGASIDVRVVAPVTLRAFAAGVAGKASASFGDNGNINVVAITTSAGTQALTLNDLLGGGATIDLDGLLKVQIGLTPTTHVSADGTAVDAIADLVHVQVVGAPSPSQGSVGGPLGTVLNPVLAPVFSALDSSGVFQQIDTALQSAGLTQAADIRIGHFESRAQVPAGGIVCAFPVTKKADKATVPAGQSFVYTITVSNPFHCPLSPVKLVDDISADPGLHWTVTATDPKASSVSTDRVVWNDIGPIAAGASKSVTLTVHVDKASSAGDFTDHAAATGTCTGDATTGNAVATLTSDVTVVVPHVTVTATAPEAGPLPNTGGSSRLPWVALAVIVAALASALRLRARLHD